MSSDDKAAGGDARSLFQSLKEKLKAIPMAQPEHAEPHEEKPAPGTDTWHEAEAQDMNLSTDSMVSEDPEQLLAKDPRTMWAWSVYAEYRFRLPVSSHQAQQILGAIPPGDHVEIFTAVVISATTPKPSPDAFPQGTRFAAKTFDSWVLPSQNAAEDVTVIPSADAELFTWTSFPTPVRVAKTEFHMIDGRIISAYSDKKTSSWLHEGVGRSILRLPDNPLTPFPPGVGTGNMSAFPPDSDSPKRLLSDWHSAEEVALWHMSERLAFFGSRLTGGVADKGVDVEHPQAVAQVKMQANPVGSPQIRQLRGARPHLANHIFYSTSGYTRAAIAEAAESSVALFLIDDDGTPCPYGAEAEQIILEGLRRHGGDEALVAAYIQSVSKRVMKAEANYGWGQFGSVDAYAALRETHSKNRNRLERAESHLKGAVNAVTHHPRIGSATHKSIVSHFRNADLRAAFFCQALGLAYPGDKPLGRNRKTPTAADFY
ncbi:restriction endonuclease [Pseudarthrobacter defluvii]|uniref:restriction endonuclease n=1 Tax=Pseudarthrobacter defluvii TaxID=410837 RepID=UPI002578508C|nr:restriction endonuclease [Pseudarthrobacter defluvii]WJH25430.1 restriction endonuclease [Pseudarthrobacter defluvii]